MEKQNGNKQSSFELRVDILAEQVRQYVESGDIDISPPQVTDIVSLKAAQRGLKRVIADSQQRSLNGQYIYHDDNPSRLDRFSLVNTQILNAHADSPIDFKPDRVFVDTKNNNPGNYDEIDGWRGKAACKGLVDLFYPEDANNLERKQKIQKAQEICKNCEVKEECRKYSKDEQFGVWAGEYKPNPKLSKKLNY